MSISVDCSWNSWHSWNSCTKSCGGGTKQRTRTSNNAVCGGAACIGYAVEQTDCNTHCCAGKSFLASNMTKNFLSISICLFQLTVLGIAGNHGAVVPNLVEVVPNKKPGPKIMPCVEVQIVQAMLLSKQIVTPIVVLVNQRSLSDMIKIFFCLFQFVYFS